MPTPNIDHSLEQLKDVLAVAHDEELTEAQQAILEKYRGDMELPGTGGYLAYVATVVIGLGDTVTAIEHHNTLGEPLTWSVQSAGVVRGVLAGAFPLGRTRVIAQPNGLADVVAHGYRSGSEVVHLVTRNFSGTLTTSNLVDGFNVMVWILPEL